MTRIIIIYIGLFVALTYGDYWTTNYAITSGLAEEFNPAVRDGATAYKVGNMLLINIAFLLVTSWLLYWSINNKKRIADRFLNTPIIASFNYFYLNPFNDKNATKSPLHILAFALCCLFAKIFAIVSNSFAITKGFGLADPIVALLAPYLTGIPLYFVATGLIISPMWIFGLFLAASWVKKDNAKLSIEAQT